MYDAFRSYYQKDNRHLFVNPKKFILHYSIIFRPSYKSENEVSYFRATFQKITIKIYKHKIVFSGSFHTSSKGHNAGEFNMSDLKVLFRLLNNKFGDDFMKSTISNLEYGLLVENDEVNWIRYKNVFVDKMKDKYSGKEYGQKITLCDFELKRYDKAVQMTLKDRSFASLPTAGFRLEVKIKRMRSIQKASNKVEIYRVEDLMQQRHLKDMHAHLTKLLHRVTKESRLCEEKLINDKKLRIIYGVMNCELTNIAQKKANLREHKSYQTKMTKLFNEMMKPYGASLDSYLSSHIRLVIN